MIGLPDEAEVLARLATAALFRRVAAEVGAELGYAYPRRVDDAVTAHLNAVRQLPKVTG
jgi:hypothetical protein